MARTNVLLLATAILLLTGTQGAGLRSSVECLSGQGVSLTSFKCTNCEPGTFSNGREPCVPCPKDTYAELAGSAECVACPTEFQWRPVCVQADGSYSTANCETGALACWRPAQVASAEAQEHATSRHLMSNLMSRVRRALKQAPIIGNVTVPAPPPTAASITPPAPVPSPPPSPASYPPSPYRDALPLYSGPEGTPVYGGDYIQFLYDEVAYVMLPGGSYINIQGTLVYASVNGGPIYSSVYGGQVLAPVNGPPQTAAVYPGYAGAYPGYPGGGVGYGTGGYPGTYPTVITTPVYSSTYGGPVYGVYQANTPPGAYPPRYGTYAVYGSYGQSGTYGSYGVYGAYTPVYPAPTYGSYSAPLYGAYGSGLTPGGAYGPQVSGIYGAYGPQTAPQYGPTYLPGPGYGPASVGYGPAYAGNSPVYGLPLYGIDLAPVYYKPGMRRRHQ